MSIPREGSRDTGDGILVSIYPDVCLTPCGNSMVPVPYNIWAKQNPDANTTPTVRMTSLRAHNLGSLITESHGAEAGTGGGVASGTNCSVCQPLEHSKTVRAEGKNVVRHTDTWWMNNKNTQGKLIYTKDMAGYAVTAQAQPKPAPAPAPEPAPKPPGQVIRPNIPHWQGPRIPPPVPPSMTTQAWRGLPRLGGRLLGVIGGVLIPSDLDPWSDMPPRDAVEGQIIDMGRNAVKNGADVQETRKWVHREIAEYREAQTKKDEATVPDAGVTPDNVRVTGEKEKDKKRPCRTGPYSALKNACSPGEQAHHIVPDYTLRYGSRPEGVAGQKRIPGLPAFNDGPSICLKGYAKSAGDEHGIAHTADAQVAALGQGGNPIGTAPINKITEISVRAAIKARPECAKEIMAAVAQQPSLLGSTLARTTTQPPGAWPPGSK